MGKCTNIAMHAIRNNATRLNIRFLFYNNLLLNFKDKKENKNTNKGNDNVFSKEELTTTDTNLQPKTLDLPIFINHIFNSTLSNLYITVTHFILCRLKPKKARPNINKKPNTGFPTLATNNLDLSSNNFANGSFICKQRLKNIFTFLELINKVNKKQK